MMEVTSMLDAFKYKPKVSSGAGLKDIAAPRVIRTLGDPVTAADQQRIFDQSIPKPPATVAAQEEPPVKPAPIAAQNKGTAPALSMEGSWGTPEAV